MSRPRDVKGRLDETTIRSSVKSRNLIEQMCRLVEERLPREWPFVQTTQRMMVDALVWNAIRQGDDAIVRIVQQWRFYAATGDAATAADIQGASTAVEDEVGGT